MAVPDEPSTDSHDKPNGLPSSTKAVNGAANGTLNGTTHAAIDGISSSPPLNRAEEVSSLLTAVQSLLIPFIKSADDAVPFREQGISPTPVLVTPLPPSILQSQLSLSLPAPHGSGQDGVLDLVARILRHSVNTWDQGYLDKLCAATDAVGVASELVLAVLNTNAHVYRVSPALTVVEKATARAAAGLFGLVGPRAGGFTCAGGSASNLTSLVTARAALYPATKEAGNGAAAGDFVVFAGEHGHYSVEKAAVACGIGLANVRLVPADADGRMDPSALRELVVQAKAEGKTPLYVCATAGTTVLGAYDPLRAVAAVCRDFGLWLHVDASWGGAAAFSATHKHKLDGAELADSITFNPHKMLHVPATCSFLLARDTAVFRAANTLPAGYLFHGDAAASSSSAGDGNANTAEQPPQEDDDDEVWDLADLTLQCGRRADSLKLALAWTYHGSSGFEAAVDGAFAAAAHFAALVDAHPDFALASPLPLPCLQVCFYYAPGGELGNAVENGRRTREMGARLVERGFMVDYAPGPVGSFFRVAFNLQTLVGTTEGLLRALEAVGREVVPVAGA